jgi:hypothetical protein
MLRIPHCTVVKHHTIGGTHTTAILRLRNSRASAILMVGLQDPADDQHEAAPLRSTGSSVKVVAVELRPEDASVVPSSLVRAVTSGWTLLLRQRPDFIRRTGGMVFHDEALAKRWRCTCG